MNGRTGSFLAAVWLATAVAAPAQWLDYRTPGIPRSPDGKPNLSAPAPRKADGKPDLSGIWMGDPQNAKYRGNLAADFKPGDFPIQPWADAITAEDPGGCLPPGIPMLDSQSGFPSRIIQEPDLIVILHEYFGQFRQIFADGRKLPSNPNPTWLGYSVGRWDGDVLVVETAGFNGKTRLDGAGHPSTEALHVIERFQRRDLGHLDVLLTINDPKAYTRPWTVTLAMHLLADTEMLEFVCNENEKDLRHMK